LQGFEISLLVWLIEFTSVGNQRRRRTTSFPLANIPFFANFENFHVKFEFKFCSRITVTFSIDTPGIAVVVVVVADNDGGIMSRACCLISEIA
jgi:hypothetical protein